MLDNAGASIPASGTCTITVDVAATSGGSYANDIPAGALQTSAGSNTVSADATLQVVDPPTLTKVFAPAAITAGQTSDLTITIGNSNAVALTSSAALVDSFPPGIVVDATPNATTTCGGTVTAATGSDSVTLDSGASIPPGGCTVSVVVTAAAPGTYPNVLGVGALQTDLGSNQIAAGAILSVTP